VRAVDSADCIVALCATPIAGTLARALLCLVLVPVLASHGYALHLTWFSIRLTPVSRTRTGAGRS
jgi:hypothetical protein